MTQSIPIKELARLAKVSVSTVTLALAGNARVASATRARIVDLAASMGYLASAVPPSAPAQPRPDESVKRVSLKDIARITNVSVSLVSLALAGDGRVAAATRQRIEQVAHEQGYVRSPLLSGLASSRFRHTGKPAIVAVIGSPMDGTAELAHHCQAMGMAIREVPRLPADELTVRLRELEAVALVVQCRGVDLAFLAQLTIPVVVWQDDHPGELVVDVVDFADWWGTTIATLAQVKRMGYRKPVFINVPAIPRHWQDDVRLSAARLHGVPVCETNLKDGPEIVRFLAQHDPDAVIGLVPMVRETIRRLGYRLPVASLILVDGYWSDGLAGMKPDFDHRCRTTCEIIEHRLRFGPRPPRLVIVPPRWQHGPSLPHQI